MDGNFGFFIIHLRARMLFDFLSSYVMVLLQIRIVVISASRGRQSGSGIALRRFSHSNDLVADRCLMSGCQSFGEADNLRLTHGRILRDIAGVSMIILTKTYQRSSSVYNNGIGKRNMKCHRFFGWGRAWVG